ncbi:hypothetical protein ABIF26_002742 [Bradyrhizobium elkanii]
MAQGLVLERFVEERAIEAVLEDRSNRGDGARLDEDAPPAGCVEAFGAVAFDERQNAKAGSKALFWMGPGVDHGLEKRCCRRTDPLAGIARRSGSEERGDQDGESVSRRDDDRRDDCRAQEFCLL